MTNDVAAKPPQASDEPSASAEPTPLSGEHANASASQNRVEAASASEAGGQEPGGEKTENAEMPPSRRGRARMSVKIPDDHVPMRTPSDSEPSFVLQATRIIAIGEQLSGSTSEPPGARRPSKIPPAPGIQSADDPGWTPTPAAVASALHSSAPPTVEYDEIADLADDDLAPDSGRIDPSVVPPPPPRVGSGAKSLDSTLGVRSSTPVPNVSRPPTPLPGQATDGGIATRSQAPHVSRAPVEASVQPSSRHVPGASEHPRAEAGPSISPLPPPTIAPVLDSRTAKASNAAFSPPVTAAYNKTPPWGAAPVGVRAPASEPRVAPAEAAADSEPTVTREAFASDPSIEVRETVASEATLEARDSSAAPDAFDVHDAFAPEIEVVITDDHDEPEGARDASVDVEPDSSELLEISVIEAPPDLDKVLPPRPPEAARAAVESRVSADGDRASRPADSSPIPKKRPWWEELFDDDFVRSMTRLADKQVSIEASFIEERLGLAKGAQVLDIGCGRGKHAVELARRGYELVGFDLSLAMLAHAADEAAAAQQTAIEQGDVGELKINLQHGDMRELGFENRFDGVYCWDTSFGYFDEEKNISVLQRVHRALRPGGVFLLDVYNRDFVAQRQPSLVWFEGEGCICMDEMQVDFITSRLKVKRTLMLEDGRTREVDYSVRLYGLHELGKMLRDAGFRVVEVTGQPAAPGIFLGCESPRCIILAERD